MFYLVIKNNFGWFSKLCSSSNQFGPVLNRFGPTKWPDIRCKFCESTNEKLKHSCYFRYLHCSVLIVVQCCSKTLVIMNEIRDSQCNSMHSFYARRSLNYKDFCYSRLIKQERISCSPDPTTNSEFCFTNFLNFQS